MSIKNKSQSFINEWVMPTIDWTCRLIAAAFILTTSFLEIRDRLRIGQLNHDLSLVGAILVVSVALYLVVRKRDR